MRAPRHIYVTKDHSRVVEATDPDVGMLLYAAGDDIPEEEVKRLGLRDKLKAEKEATAGAGGTAPPPARAQPEPEPPPAEAKAEDQSQTEDKAVESPSSRRARGG